MWLFCCIILYFGLFVVGKSLSHLVNYTQQFTFINSKQIGSEADLSCDYQHYEAKADLIVHLYDLYLIVHIVLENLLFTYNGISSWIIDA